MKYTVSIKSVNTVDELEGSWNNSDLVELLKRFNYEEAGQLKPEELKEYLFLAINDFEPNEAAAIVLDYKLSEHLTPGQIDNLSNDMLRDRVPENYSDIYIHEGLFEVNQLLYKAYNGKFPLVKATVVEFEIKPESEEDTEPSKESILQALSAGLSDSNLMNRLFKEQLEGNASFSEAEGIIWDLKNKGNSQYIMVTSEKWLKKDDFTNMEFECEVTPFVETEEE